MPHPVRCHLPGRHITPDTPFSAATEPMAPNDMPRPCCPACLLQRLQLIVTYQAKICLCKSTYTQTSIADAAAGSGIQFPSVANPGGTALLTSGAPAAAEAPGMAEAAAPVGAIAAAPAPGMATVTVYHIDQNQMRHGHADITKQASCFYATRDPKSSDRCILSLSDDTRLLECGAACEYMERCLPCRSCLCTGLVCGPSMRHSSAVKGTNLYEQVHQKG